MDIYGIDLFHSQNFIQIMQLTNNPNEEKMKTNKKKIETKLRPIFKETKN